MMPTKGICNLSYQLLITLVSAAFSEEKPSNLLCKSKCKHEKSFNQSVQVYLPYERVS